MAAVNNGLPGSLLDLLSNDLILRHTSPYIGIRSLVSLAATSKAYQSLVYRTPQVFQHVDLQVFDVSLERQVCLSAREIEEAYTQKMSDVFTALENRNILHGVRTLNLDGLFVPITVIEDILCNERYQIRLLSWREPALRLPKNELLRILRHLIRPSRPKGTPNLRGIYLFGPLSRIHEVSDSDDVIHRPGAIGITASVGAQIGAGNSIDYDPNDLRKLLGEDPYSNSPYGAPGTWSVEEKPWEAPEWPEILEACAGLIHFDAVLCRHDQENVPDPGPKIATVRLAGCRSCGTCPEGPAYPGTSPADHLPILSPPPLHSSRIEVAQRIDTNGQPYPPLILRCRTCLKDRWCERCNVWWCELCYTIPKNRGPTKGDPASTISSPAWNGDIKVHNGLCVSQCLMAELLYGDLWG